MYWPTDRMQPAPQTAKVFTKHHPKSQSAAQEAGEKPQAAAERAPCPAPQTLSQSPSQTFHENPSTPRITTRRATGTDHAISIAVAWLCRRREFSLGRTGWRHQVCSALVPNAIPQCINARGPCRQRSRLVSGLDAGSQFQACKNYLLIKKACEHTPLPLGRG
jgi:hypothetical protein